MNRIKMKSRILLPLMGLMAVLSLNSCLNNDLSIVSEINEEFSNITEIEVDGEFLDVSYEGQTGKLNVTLEALLRANSDKRHTIGFDVVGSKLIVKLDSKNGGWGKYNSEGYIRLTGPKVMEVKLKVGSGSLTAKDITGVSPQFVAGSGNIQVSRVVGADISINSSSGVTTAADLAGKVGVTISSGRIDIQRVDGSIDAEASSGEIKLTDINGLVNTTVSSGKIELLRVLAIGKGQISSGQIFATSTGLSPSTNLKSSSGNIYIQTGSRLKDFNFNITAGSGSVRVGDSQSSGNLVINNGAAHTIRGEVSSGKIEIVN